MRVSVVVISSKILSGREPDEGQPAIERMIAELPATLVSYEVVADERDAIRDRLLFLCGIESPDVIVTLGGTGVRPTDWAPEATRDVIEKEIPGIGEAMRQESLKKVRTAMLSRGTAGLRGGTLIVNLPGSPTGATENLAVLAPILEHTVEKIRPGKKPA
ncbi:MAG: MogA/MoaB family molybdenum cofactor biosynthesis protein [Nitrospirota bacterium]|nr:MogA/MoaB family molybdenum cofactor biosynthesis protein [Nitrospirota bacterium]MDE3118035.1 MogA/MoaB family molybdenum cofactor biosynthesis protein [Nitrospirota bacterium]MDE3224114.1 MogA/MoaB family molybdenum cofactor biosynthesis protein [Nitrospirota bacterium]MDE3242066.1 MogA/MoaB family molybdenum cofactor biosynthesis protein [Nitrospirota bacterium]